MPYTLKTQLEFNLFKEFCKKEQIKPSDPESIHIYEWDKSCATIEWAKKEILKIDKGIK